MILAVPLPNPRISFAALDVFRGTAAVFMIMNHAGFRLLSTEDATGSTAGILVFLGSFAPVLFFFATGFGIALSNRPQTKTKFLGELLFKALALIVADQFFFWKADAAWGLDFFSFIAISTVIVSLISRVRISIAICSALIVFIIALRYGIGPIFRIQLTQYSIVSWLVGITALENVSYPLSPWLAYPLLGFIFGQFYKTNKTNTLFSTRLWLAFFIVSIIAIFGLSAMMAIYNGNFFRWGTVSSAFFVLSLGILFGIILLSAFMTFKIPNIANKLALRGVSSFAVIPIHYALLELLSIILRPPVEKITYVSIMLLLTIVSFVLASKFSSFIDSAASTKNRYYFNFILLVLLTILATTTQLIHGYNAIISILVFLGQMTVAAILGLRTTRLSNLNIISNKSFRQRLPSNYYPDKS